MRRDILEHCSFLAFAPVHYHRSAHLAFRCRDCAFLSLSIFRAFGTLQTSPLHEDCSSLLSSPKTVIQSLSALSALDLRLFYNIANRPSSRPCYSALYDTHIVCCATVILVYAFSLCAPQFRAIDAIKPMLSARRLFFFGIAIAEACQCL